MTPYPKHYLADVPHDLRMRVLDLCIHRQWHDAIELLHQNGFSQYEWYELVWFHDHAPTNLDPIPATSTDSTGDSPVPVGDQPTGILPSEEDVSASTAQAPPPSRLTLTPLRELRASVVRCCPVKPKRRKPRSKACRLPKEIQDNLNTLLAGGRSYREIIHWLNERGYPSFNKANLHNWRTTGFQDWLRNRNLQAPEDVRKVSGRCPEGHGRSRKVTEGDLISSPDRKPI